MKLAVTFENENIFQHFGHTEFFKLYDIENNSVKNSEVVSTGGTGHEALAVFLRERNVEALICGGIGGGAKAALEENGIKILGGVKGSADEAVKAYLAGTLVYSSEANCSHHDGEHHNDAEHHNDVEHKQRKFTLIQK